MTITMTHNPNQQPSVQTELSPEEKAILSLDAVNAWRTHEHAVLHGLREADNYTNDNYADDFARSVDELLDDFLQTNGLDQTSANYAEIRQVFYDARIGRGNGDGISNSEWSNSPASRGVDANDHKSQSDVFAERLEQLRGNSLDSDGSDADSRGELDDAALSEAYLDNARFDVGISREAWATVSAKRQGRAFSVKDKERESVRDTYHENVQKLGIMELESQIDDDDDDLTKNAKVIQYLFDEQAKLRDLTIEKLQNTKVGKFVTFMNKGSRKARFMKAVGFGVIAGAGGSIALGAVGAGVAAASLVGMSRFVRGYVRGDKHRGMDTAEQALKDDDGHMIVIEEGGQHSLADRLHNASIEFDESFEEDTRREQHKRKKALAFGIGSVALGATAGYLLTNLDGVGETTGELKNRFVDWFNDDPRDIGGDGADTPEPGGSDSGNTLGDGDTTPADASGGFTVEHGHGYTHELMDYTKAHGGGLSPEDSLKLHEHLTAEFGKDYININGTNPDTYLRSAGDTGLSAPGKAHWAKGVESEISRWLSNR